MRVAFVVNSGADGAMGDRARAFAERLGRPWQVAIGYRDEGRLGSIASFAQWLHRLAPDVIYVFDMALAGVIAGTLTSVGRRRRLIVDTGDAITALARSVGRGPAGLAATAALERLAVRAADHLVVRGTYHREWLAARGVAATVIPDGVDLATFRPLDGAAARAGWGIADEIVVGLVGSSVWNPRLEIAYGWDLVELLALTRDLPVRGVIVGDGSGIERLRQRASWHGVADRLVLLGRRPLAELPGLLAGMDVCLSTQTNDLPGQVRTTGKLPLYLACGRYVLASLVGEAARVLPPEMLVPYDGVVDRSYPARLAERVRALAADRTLLARGRDGVAIAARHFDYDLLARRAAAVIAGEPLAVAS